MSCNDPSSVNFYDHFTTRIDDLSKNFNDRCASIEYIASERARNAELNIKIAAEALEARLNLLNEFRSTIESRERLFATKESVDLLTTLVSELRIQVGSHAAETREHRIIVTPLVSGLISIGVGIVMLFLGIWIGEMVR